MRKNFGLMALLGVVLISGVAGWWMTRIPSPAAPVSERSGLTSNVKADLPPTVDPVRTALPLQPSAAMGVSEQFLDADDPMSYEVDFASSAPVNVGELMDADDPLTDGEDFTPSETVNVGEPMDADDPMTDDMDYASTAPVNVGHPMDADDPMEYGDAFTSTTPVNVGELLDADQEFLADNQQ